jgi:citrate lyase subunit beta/citryl-CoA lyase/(3S)-malyl-CoA thioesterase
MFRSVLFVPSANARAVAKAPSLRADALIFDLEDAVGAAEREAALENLRGVLSQDVAAAHVLVRIHPGSLNTTHKALAGLRLDGLVVPKVNGTEDLHAVMMAWPKLPVWAMIETAEGVANLWEIAGMPLAGLIAGPNDLRKSLRTRPLPQRADIAYALSQIVVHARAHHLVALDGVYNAFRDMEGFRAECNHGRALGFDGKTLIHPDQIAPCEAAFSPSEAEIAWARSVTSAFANTEAGVVAVNGEMVERLHLAQAQAILSD